MSKNKHTLGPWAAEMISADTEGNTYAMIVSKPQEVVPNLNLINAAPEMLEALEHLSKNSSSEAERAYCEKIVAKAKGEV